MHDGAHQKGTGQQWFSYFLMTYGNGANPPPDARYMVLDNNDQMLLDNGDDILTDEGQ